jgi:hypothetical protein
MRDFTRRQEGILGHVGLVHEWPDQRPAPARTEIERFGSARRPDSISRCWRRRLCWSGLPGMSRGIRPTGLEPVEVNLRRQDRLCGRVPVVHVGITVACEQAYDLAGRCLRVDTPGGGRQDSRRWKRGAGTPLPGSKSRYPTVGFPLIDFAERYVPKVVAFP